MSTNPPATNPGARIDPHNLARAAVIGAWALFFTYLLVTGEVARYLGPRTRWVVPFGMIVLGIAAVAQVGALRSRAPRRLSVSQALAYAVVVLPLAAVVVVPAGELGSLAAAKKAPGTGLASALAFAPPAPGERALSQIDVHYASQAEDYAREAGIVDGMPLELTGFVTHGDGPAADFRLTRFYISCCAADAVPYSVSVDAAGRDFPDDTWLRVAGTLVVADAGLVLESELIEEIESPRDPYL